MSHKLTFGSETSEVLETSEVWSRAINRQN